ncbi:MAG: ankyrin repeat domain-containing protein, partial [Pseudomonas sp.]|nr:ankyrin repeat domain-containing protein [Pseudomonas sp.]
MQTDPPGVLDDEALAFAEKVFDFARDGNTRGLAPLLQAGLPANLRNHKGDSLLMLASYHGHLETSTLLLKHGADPDLANDRGQTPLAGVVFKGERALIDALILGGADVNFRPPGGKTAMMFAAMFNQR